MPAPEIINNEVISINGYIDDWDESTANTLHYKNTHLLDLKQQILANIEIINSRIDDSTNRVLLHEIQSKLAAVNQHLPNVSNSSHFNACIDANFEVTRTLSQFGYSNNRVDNVIRSSLSSRKEAQRAHQDTIEIAQEIEKLKVDLDDKQQQIESFFDHCFNEEDADSFDNKTKSISEAYEKICTVNGYSESIETANNESIKYRNEILEYKNELFENDNENESIQTQVNDLLHNLLAQQKKIQGFIQDYITGTSTIIDDVSGNETTTANRSKKQLIDELHDNFQQHIDNQKNKISEYQTEFEKYESGKREEIEGLLKMATNASLASSFEVQRKKTRNAKMFSELLFWLALVLVVAAILIPYIPDVKALMFNTKDDVYLNLLKRALLTSPFIWWAFHLSRKANQYFRLEQEYAHKAVVSRSFEGYKSQVLELYKESEASNTMLQRLLSGSIDTITENPTDILDKVKHTSSPVEEFNSSIMRTVENAGKNK